MTETRRKGFFSAKNQHVGGLARELAWGMPRSECRLFRVDRCMRQSYANLVETKIEEKDPPNLRQSQWSMYRTSNILL